MRHAIDTLTCEHTHRMHKLMRQMIIVFSTHTPGAMHLEPNAEGRWTQDMSMQTIPKLIEDLHTRFTQIILHATAIVEGQH